MDQIEVQRLIKQGAKNNESYEHRKQSGANKAFRKILYKLKQVPLEFGDMSKTFDELTLEMDARKDRSS